MRKGTKSIIFFGAAFASIFASTYVVANDLTRDAYTEALIFVFICAWMLAGSAGLYEWGRKNLDVVIPEKPRIPVIVAFGIVNVFLFAGIAVNLRLNSNVESLNLLVFGTLLPFLAGTALAFYVAGFRFQKPVFQRTLNI